MVMTSAGTDSAIVVRLVASTSRNARNASAAPTTSASHGVEFRRSQAAGRAVRSTWASNRRSAQSLIAQPAERMRIVPSVKMTMSDADGAPSAASHSADSVGQSRSAMPIGLSRRMSRS